MKFHPKTVVWEITYKCNAKCIHCGSDCLSEEKDYQLTTAECLDVVYDLADIGAEFIILSGGEPLLREDFGIIAAAIKNLGMDVGFISNSIAVNQEMMKVIKSVEPKGFGISLDAGEAWLHDYIRGHKGTFDNVVKTIRLLHQNGIAPSIVSTIHKLNFNQLAKMRDLLIDQGVRYWQIQYADFIGRMPREAMLTEGQYFELSKFILDLKVNYKDEFDVVSGADVMGYMSNYAQMLQGKWMGCQAGMYVLGLCSDGAVRGCLSLQRDEYIEDNVRNRPLKEIWNDRNSFAFNRHFDCSMLSGYCKDCTYGSVCKGGCLRAATSNGEGRCNPYCLYKLEQEGFSSEEQSKIDFTKEEIAEIYGKTKKLPDEFWK